MTRFRILYINGLGRTSVAPITGVARISNYLNSKMDLSQAGIEEDVLCLLYEDLPLFSFEDIDNYRCKLRDLLEDTYERFNFDLVAISCYTPFFYKISLEIAFTLKSLTNSNIITVIGGVHPTIRPEDFSLGEIPNYFYEFYSRDIVPVNFVIRGEAEMGFYKLIKRLLDKDSASSNYGNTFNIIISELIDDLSKVPLLDLSLYEKYKLQISDKSEVCIESSRGCPYQCTFCITSVSALGFYNKYRIKPISLFFKELKYLKEEAWVTTNMFKLGDPLFYPMKKMRTQFFEQLTLMKKDFGFDNTISLYDLVNTCSLTDLENYKKLNIWADIGLESVSIDVLRLMNKTNSQNVNTYYTYLRKAKKLIEISSNINLSVIFNIIFGFPGSTAKQYSDFREFFFKKINGRALIEKYKVSILFMWYQLLPSANSLHLKCEKEYGSRIFFKKWWKEFNSYSRMFAWFFKPSQTLSFEKHITETSQIMKKVFKVQEQKGNRFYSKEIINGYNNSTKKLKSLFNLYPELSRA